MKSSNRFLLGFGIILAVLMVITIVLVSVSKNNVTTYADNTPEGVVQRYLQAVLDGDYQKAYSYTKIVENGRTPTPQELMPYPYRPPGVSRPAWRATLGKTTITNDTALVEVIVDMLQQQGPFGNPVNSQTVIFNLTKINGTWYITTRPPTYWIY